MTKDELYTFFHDSGIVPVVKIDDAEKAVPLAKAMIDGGINSAEITFRTAAAEEAIRKVTAAYPDMIVGAGTVITSSTKIVDVSGEEPRIYRGYVPPRSVVIPGTYPKRFPAGEYGVPCALIIGQRKESTDLKTSLNDALRDFDVPV